MPGQEQSESIPKGLSKQAQERWIKLSRETLDAVEIPAVLKDAARAALDTPQFGPYHNEGILMASHLGLMLENISRVRDGSFDFAQLGLSGQETMEFKAIIEKEINEHAQDMAAYAYLHDIKKPDCMNVEYVDADGNKKRRIFTIDEWNALRETHGDDEESLRSALKSQGITKIGYRQDEALTGAEARDHGPEAEKFFRELAADNPEMDAFVRRNELLIKGIANHEIHFQVFNSAKSAKQFEAKLVSQFTEEEINFILTANFLDIASSLDKGGKADYSGLRNMLEARSACLLIRQFQDERVAAEKPLRENELGALKNLAGIEAVRDAIEKIKNPPRTSLTEGERAQVMAKLQGWMSDLKIPEDRRQAVEAALRDENYARALGQLGLGKLAGAIRQFLTRR